MAEHGVIYSINHRRGCGLIRRRETRRSVYFDATGLADGIEFGRELIGEAVEFVTSNGPRGPRAIDIKAAT